jgi:integrase
VSKGSINGELRTLKAALHRAVDNADLDRLPCKIKLLKTGSKLPTVLDECQLRLLLKASPQLWLRTLLLLGAKAGLRHAEALWLRPCDIDADEIRVVSKAGWSPKSHHERRLPLRSPSLRAALDEYLPTVADRGWLFPGYDGGPLAGAHKAVRAAFKTAGLYDRADRSGMHMLRRTWATALLGAGVDIETVRQLGGWRDIETVQRYVTSDAKRKDAAMGAIG